MTHYDLVIRGGTVATASDCFRADVAVTDGRIVAIGENLGPAAREISAEGRLVLPGGVDSHCHIEEPQVGEVRNAETFASATSSAAAGGTTTVISFSQQVKGSELFLNNFDQPLIVLAGYCQRVLESEHLLNELVREADVEWGRVMDERPHFESEGSSSHPDDPYTIDSVRTVLSELLKQLAADAPRA